MDLSKLSDADLDAVLAGDMSKVSGRGLDIISGTAPKPQGGFKAAVSAGIEGLKGAGYALAGRTGLMDTAEAEAGQQRAKERAEDTFAPTEDGWTESPWLKTKELLGGSLPYMAAPVVAGGAATFAGAPALAATGLAGLASAAQFTATNLDRQTDDRKLKDTDLSAAVLAAVPQAALDMIGLGRIPGVRQLIGAVAKDVGVDGAKSLVGQSLKQTVADYAKTTGKAMGAEGITEAGQQVLERLQAGLKINDPAARKEYWDSFVGGAVLGGALSPAGRYVERGQIQNKERALAKVQDAEQQAQQAAEAHAAEMSAPNPSSPLSVPDTGPLQGSEIPAHPGYMPPQADMFSEQTAKPVEVTDTVDPAQRKQELTGQLRRLQDALEQRRDAVAKAETPEDSLRAATEFSRFETALKQAQKEHDGISIPKTPDEVLASTYTAWNKAKEQGDVAAVAKHAAKIVELKAAGATPPSAPMKQTTGMPLKDIAGAYNNDTMANEIADKWAAAKTQREKTEAEQAGIQRLADNAKQPSEALAIKNAIAKDSRDVPKPEPTYAQQNLLDTAETEGARSDAKLDDAAGKLVETVVDPHAVGLEKQIGDLEDARDQAKAAGRDGDAATYQARIGELQRRGEVNPHDADVVSRVDEMHKQLEQAKRDAENARVTKNVNKAESANKAARDIADQMAQVQQEPGSVAGRLIKAKNDTSSSLTAFFDAAHEIHTAGTESRLREKQTYLRSVLNDMRNRGAVNDKLGEGQMHVSVADVLRQLRAIEAQIGSLGAGESAKTVAARGRQAITKYVRAAFREENIRREARNQKPLEGAAREAFAKHTQKQAERVLTRVMADRGGDYMEEHVVRPAVMRSGKIIRGPITEFRDSRALKDRPYAKFSRAREVEEESFLEQRAALQHKSTATRVESGVLKRQWAADESKRTADEQGENATTRRGQMRRRAEYLGNQLDASAIDVSEMRAALEQYPTNAVMDALAPMVKDARTGMPPDADSLQRLREVVALEKAVAQDNTGQRSLVDEADTRFERTTPERFRNAPEVKKGRAAADEQKALVEDIGAQLEQIVKDEARPSEFQKLARSVADLRERIAAFRAARPFSGLRSLIGSLAARDTSPRSDRYSTEPMTAIRFDKKTKAFVRGTDDKTGKPIYLQSEGQMYTPEDAQAIVEQLQQYNTFIESTSKFLREQSGVDTPEYKALTTHLKEALDALAALPTDPELVQARALAAKHHAALRSLLAMPEPTRAAGRAARLRNIENTQDALRIAEGILRLKERTPSDDPSYTARKQERADAKTAADTARVQAAVTEKNRQKEMDAAVEERMRLDEMERRLAKLPHTTVTREAEGAFAKLVSVGLRKEASGLEAMIDAAKAFPKPDEAYIAKLEKMLAASNKAYEQLEGQLPRKIERSAEAGTSEADDVLQPDDKWRRPSGADTKAAVSAAQKLEARNKGRGRGPTMVTERGPRKISGSGVRRPPSVQSAMREANLDSARARIEKIEDLQEKLAAKQAEATGKKAVAKYAAYEARLEKAHAAATAALEAAQPKTKTEGAAEAEDTAKEFSDTGTLASVETRQALRDGDIQGTVDGLIRDGSTPEVRALAEKLKPFLEGVKIGTDPNVKHEGKSVAGLYEESRNKITMHPDRLTEEDILHELTHAASAAVFNTPDADLAPHVRAAKQAVIQMWESMRNSPAFFAGEYANVSAKEFASEVFSNPALRSKMDSAGKPKTLLQRFVTAIARMFGGGRTASEKALAHIEKILSPARAHFGGTNTAKAASGSMVGTLSAQLYAPKTTALERLTKNFGMRFEQSLVDMRAPLDQALKTGKGEAAAQAMYFMRKADARMSHVYAVLSEGALKLVKGAKGHFIIEAGNSASAKDLFESVGKLKGANTEQKMATADLYMKAIRAKRVGVSKMDLGKTTEAQLNALLKEVDSDPEQKAAMDEVRRVYNDYNRGMIEFLAESGAIPKALAKELLKHGDYVPYYRVKGSIGEFMFDEEHPITIGDVRHQKYLQELKGDDDKFLPLNEAVMRNTLLLTDMAMRNIAAKSVAYAMQDIGKGKGPVSAKTGKPTNLMSIQTGYGDDKHGTTVRFNQEPDPSDPSDDGKRHIKIQTEGTAAEFIPSGMLAQSIEGMSVTLPSFLKGAGWFSDVLRSGVTRNPMYVMRQLIRDPLSAAFTSGLDTQPLTAVAKSMAEFGRQMTGHSPTAAALIRKGVLHSQIFNGSPSDLAKMSLQIAGGNNEGVYKLFAMADKAAMAADSATRAQMYESVIRRGGSEMEAEMAAIEMMNFHKRGGSPGALYASRMIPFFNAQIQGLNVLVKAASGKATLEDKLQIREKFINRALGLAAFTTLYAAAMSDDEEYKNARPRDRYSNFFIPLPNGTTIKAPIPFEVGLLFKALPEAFIDCMRDEFHEEEWQAVRHMLISSIPGAASWGMPQAVKPLVEVVANHDFYTGNPIESAGMEKLTPEMRFNANTTELAKQLSSGVGGAISPVKLEKLVNGYLGGLPVAIAALANEVFNTSGIARPERKLTETPVFGSAFQDVNGGGATDAMYAKIKALNEAKASAKKLEEMGDMQGVERLHTEVIDTLTGAVAGEAEKVLQELSKTEREIRLSDLTPERKREELDRVAADRTREMQRFLKITREATEPA